MTKHTNGPWDTCHMDGWNVSFDFKGEGTVETYAICDANGKIVAFAVDHADKAFADLNTDHANLIAAAPDLLEALQEILSIDGHSSLTREDSDKLDAKARAAISKATGETV